MSTPLSLDKISPRVAASCIRVCARLALESLVPLAHRSQPNPMPFRVRGMLQVAGKIRQLFDLRREDGGLDAEVFASRYRTQELRVPPAPRYGRAQHLALPDELRREPRRAAPFAGRATQDECIAAMLHNGVSIALPIRARNLRDRLESQNAAPAKFSEARQRVLEAIDLAEGVQF